MDPIGKKPRCAACDKSAVLEFAEHMYDKLRANAHKAHWSTVSTDWLLNRLCDELEELRDACAKGTPDEIISEAADVANFAMMISDNARIE